MFELTGHNESREKKLEFLYKYALNLWWPELIDYDTKSRERAMKMPFHPLSNSLISITLRRNNNINLNILLELVPRINFSVIKIESISMEKRRDFHLSLSPSFVWSRSPRFNNEKNLITSETQNPLKCLFIKFPPVSTCNRIRIRWKIICDDGGDFPFAFPSTNITISSKNWKRVERRS